MIQAWTATLCQSFRSQIENILSELNECPESLKSQDEAIASGIQWNFLITHYSSSSSFLAHSLALRIISIYGICKFYFIIPSTYLTYLLLEV